MPNIRVMQWNIRRFGMGSVTVPGKLEALARVIAAADADIVLILEVGRGDGGMTALGRLAAEVKRVDTGHPNAHWAHVYSFPSGEERYGVLIRDLSLVRPMTFTGGDGLPQGTSHQPRRTGVHPPNSRPRRPHRIRCCARRN